MAEFRQERFEGYCQYCENCIYNMYQQWMNSQGRGRDLKEFKDPSWKEDVDALEGDFSWNAHRELGGCPGIDSCWTYKNICGNDIETEFEEYFECTEVERNNGMIAYIGPHCGQDGKTVTLGLYSDENCNEYIGNSFNINNFLGYTLEAGALDGYVTGSLARDIIPDDYFEQYWSEDLQAYYNPQEQMCIPCAASLQIYEQKGNIASDDDEDYLSSNNAYNDEVK